MVLGCDGYWYGYCFDFKSPSWCSKVSIDVSKKISGKFEKIT